MLLSTFSNNILYLFLGINFVFSLCICYKEVNCHKCVPRGTIEEHGKSMDSQAQEKICLQQKFLVTVCSRMKLLLSKGSVFVLGAMLLVAAGIASQYCPPDSVVNGNNSQCLVMENSTAGSELHIQFHYKHQ